VNSLPYIPGRPRAVDLFCGAGGASEGLDKAGYDVVGFDNWQPAVDTHNANGLKAHPHDLSYPALDDLIPECDLMWLSCPCQPFSAAGDGEGEFDGRDGFPWGLRLVAARRPAVVIFENVKGLTFAKHRPYFAGVLESLRALGYDVDWKVLNCADYGVPQTRERCFIVCRRDGGPITWPMPTHTSPAGMFTEPWVTMADALGWSGFEAVKLMGAGMVERHGERPSRRDDEPAFAVRAQGGNRDIGGFVLQRTILDYRQNAGATGEPITVDVTERPAPTVGTQSQGQWVLTRPATTIAGDTRVFQPGGHHQPGEQSQNSIRLTIPELAKLQGFPDDWVWTGTKTNQARQVGNAVPPVMAQLLAEANTPKRLARNPGSEST
jgi:DNA (cytosine-5)-methyltransferase 1